MTDKIVLGTFSSFQNDATAVALANANNALITTAVDNTLSRDGTSPNQMGANLDMNSFQIINLPAPITTNSPARLIDVTTNPTVVVPPLPLSVLNGGTGNSGTAWTTYTPTISSGSGAFTTVSATGRFKTLGKTVFVEIKITNTTNGTAASYIVATLPVAPAITNTYAISGFGGTGFLCAGNISTAVGGSCNIFKYDGTFPLVGGGDQVWVSGIYESV